MMPDLPDVVLSPTELNSLLNIERMLEVVVDQNDALSRRSCVSSTGSSGVVSKGVGGPVTCGNCLQWNMPEQVRDGRCFVCGNPLL